MAVKEIAGTVERGEEAMTVKEYNNNTLDSFIHLMNKIEYKENIDMKECIELKLTFLNIFNTLNNFINYKESMGSMNIHAGELEPIEAISPGGNTNKSFVYIAKQTNSDATYKIGITKNIEERRRTFKIGNAFIEIVASLRTDKAREIEKKLHNIFKNKQIEGEWFLLNKNDLSFIINTYNFSMGLK